MSNNNQSNQISWQGIFKGIMQQEKDALKAEELTYAIWGRLQEKFPLEETKTTQTMHQPTQTQNSKPRVKQTTEQCPSCGKAMKEIEGNSYSNYYKKMVHYRMLVCPDSNKEGTGPCQQKPIKLPVFEPKQIERAKFEDQLTDDANNVPTIEDGQY